LTDDDREQQASKQATPDLRLICARDASTTWPWLLTCVHAQPDRYSVPKPGPSVGAPDIDEETLVDATLRMTYGARVGTAKPTTAASTARDPWGRVTGDATLSGTAKE
jgi:hypothetical protein